MTHRISTVVNGAATVIAFVALCSVSVAGQTQSANSPAGGAPGADTIRTPWGDPDLQGIWTTQTLTPLERPTEFAGKEFLTPEEAAAYEAERSVNRNQDRRDGGAEADVARAYNDFWWDRGTEMVEDGRTSLIIDPQDGRIPYNPETRKRAQDQRAYRVSGPFNSPLDVDTGERCLTDGLPIVPGAYNNNFQILQTPDSVAILHEMFRDRRIIPLDGCSPSTIRQWLGDPRGHWDGETLVVETTNFQDGLQVGGVLEDADQDDAYRRAVHTRVGRGHTLRVHDRGPQQVHERVDGIRSDDDRLSRTRRDRRTAL